MASKIWNMSRVMVREGDERLLSWERDIMTSMTHPQLLLLMGHCPPNQKQKLKLVYEPITIGSLYHYLYDQIHHLPLLHVVDILLQVTDGLMFLAGRGFVHRAITSHAVQMINKGVAKLGMLEVTVKEGKVVSRPLDTGWQCVYNWLSPEVLLTEQSIARKEGDVYSLCCMMWELCMQEVPWKDMNAMEIISLASNGVTLPLFKDKMPKLLYRVMRQGLVWDVQHRDLDLEEVGDMLLLVKGEQEKKLTMTSMEPGFDANPGQKSMMGDNMERKLELRGEQETGMETMMDQRLKVSQVQKDNKGLSVGQNRDPMEVQMMTGTRLKQKLESRGIHEKLALRKEPVKLTKYEQFFPPSALNHFTSSALQTDIKRYLARTPVIRSTIYTSRILL